MKQDIKERVAHVQALTRRVGEHIEQEKLLHGCATTRWESRLNTPWSEEESPTARRTRSTPGTRLSALGRTRRPPNSVIIAGTSVSVQATATSDTLIAPTAIVLNMGERIMSSPVMEQAMVSAEKETVRLAVAT